jgi:hypothetical protein
MRKVFSSVEVSETVLVRDALLHDGVEASIQNEYSGQVAIPAFRPPMEVWIQHDRDYEKARQVVVNAISTLDAASDARPWVCLSCREVNPASFEVCWNCGREKDNTSGVG